MAASKTKKLQIQCLHYPTVGNAPLTIKIPTVVSKSNTGRRYPDVEDRFDLGIQPCIHDTVVTFHVNGVIHRFRIFWNRHVRLPFNTALPPGSMPGYRGEVIAMRVGAFPGDHNNMTVVNMGGAEQYAHEAVRRYVHEPYFSHTRIDRFLDSSITE